MSSSSARFFTRGIEKQQGVCYNTNEYKNQKGAIHLLYSHSNDPVLKDEVFQKPDSTYRGAPFWAWNCKLDKDVLCEQIEYFKQMGFGGYHMHPRVGLDTPYLSDDFLDMIRACIEKGRQEDMLSYLYDEDRWPSGAAGGLVTCDKHLREKHIEFTKEQRECVSFEEMYEAKKPYLFAAYDVRLDAEGKLLSAPILQNGAEASGDVWYAYLYVNGDDSWYNNQAYLDTLDPDAVDAFIEKTCETYKAAVGTDFGGLVPSIFTDEPQFSRVRMLTSPYGGKATLPWTEKLDAVFTQCAGKTLAEALPEILFDMPDCGHYAARYHYYNCISRLFAESFAGRYGKWCDAHGIALTGHLMQEPTLHAQSRSVGDAMRSYHHFGIPGIDMLCDNREFTTAKQCQSVVHQCGKPGMLSELYGVTNWDYDFKNHKSQGDWQAALGVTLRVPHLSWVSMKGEAKRDYPASINYQSPWFREYGYIEDHFARVNTALTRGKPDVHIAMIHPIESYWMLMGPDSVAAQLQQRLDDRFLDVTRWLLYDGADFDFLNEATLPEFYMPTDSGLQVGEMRYDAVIVPDCVTLRRTTLDILKAFASKGGKVIFAGTIPAYVDAQPSGDVRAFAADTQCIPFDKTEILAAAAPFKDVTIRLANGIPADELVSCLRIDGNGKWLFVAHGERLPKQATLHARDLVIRIRGKYIPTLYDTMTGKISALPYRIEANETVFERHFERTDSLLVRLDAVENAPGLASAEKPERASDVLPFLQKAICRRAEPNVLLLDCAEYALDDAPFAPAEEILRLDEICRAALGWPIGGKRQAQPWVIPEAPSTHTLTLRFRFESEIDVTDALLALENASICAVSLNAQSVSSESVGWYVDRDIPTLRLPPIRKGKNELIVRMPFGKRTGAEWCYILGEFGVRLQGCIKTIIPAADEVGFSSITTQGMPFYGGNLLYTAQIDTPEGDLSVRLPHVGGALVKIRLDGRELGVIALAPFTLEAGHVDAGAHTLEILCFGNRYNTFGPLHSMCDAEYVGPGEWRTRGDDWQYEYRLHDTGILSAPEIRITK